MRTDAGWIIDADDITVGLAGDPTDAWLMREDGTTVTEPVPDVTRYSTPGVWPKFLCRCDQVRRMVEETDSNKAHAAFMFNHRMAAGGLIPPTAVEVQPPPDETPRMRATRVARTLVARLQHNPDATRFEPVALTDAAHADPDAMILTDVDGSLTVETEGQPTDHQTPDVWPRYLCRAATLQSMLSRHGMTPQTVADHLATRFAEVLALDVREGPHMPPPVVPVTYPDGKTDVAQFR